MSAQKSHSLAIKTAWELSMIVVLVPVRDGSSDLAPPRAGFFLLWSVVVARSALPA
jgi:hypothetical protein